MSGSVSKALVALLGVAAPAVAWGGGGWSGGGWGSAPKFNCPGNPHKPAPICSPNQAEGWHWQGFPGGKGSTCNQYDGFDFKCSNQASWRYVDDIFDQTSDFRGRGLATRHDDGNGCMAADLVNYPSFGCSGGRTFDAASFIVVSEIDVDLELVFTQADGTSCSQYASCSHQGSTIQNTQCGNATSVTFKHRHGGDSCGFGVSSVSYASCTSTTTFPPPLSTSTSSTYSAPPTTVATTTSTTPLSTSSTLYTSSTPSSTSSIASSTSTPYSAPPSSSSTPIASTSTTTVSSVVTTSSVSTVLITSSTTIISCDSTVTGCPASSTVVSSSVITSYTTVPVTVPTTIATVTTLSTSTAVTVTTMYVTTSTTICPVTATQTAGNTTIYSTYLTTSYVPVTVTTTTTASVAPPAQSSAAPPPSGGCPSSVPSCLNTWLYLVPHCKDNTDAQCFCAAANYTEVIIDCLEAYSGADLSDAISYFQGICAPYASSNPQPFTGVPTTITVTAPAVPQTTVYITQSGTTSTVTVPAVTFTTTAQAGSSSAAGLIPAGGSSTSMIPIVPPSTSVVGSAATTTAVVGPPAQQSSVAVGTGAFTASSPSSSVPVVATGAASNKFVSGAVAFGAIIVALVL